MNEAFVPLPAGVVLCAAWPTPSRGLFAAPDSYFARTRANPSYGLPGFTRDCGRRFHRGCDIAPVAPVPTGGTTVVTFSDCALGTEYDSEEPTFACNDPVFAVAAGVVAEAAEDAGASLLGRHLLLEHRWPGGGRPFYTLYAHLQAVTVAPGDQVAAGARIGTMGQTSSSADARNWMAIAPHLHFEVWDEARRPCDPVEFLRSFLPR